MGEGEGIELPKISVSYKIDLEYPIVTQGMENQYGQETQDWTK